MAVSAAVQVRADSTVALIITFMEIALVLLQESWYR